MRETAEPTGASPTDASPRGDAAGEPDRAQMFSGDLAFAPISAENEDYRTSLRGGGIRTYPSDFSLEALHEKWRDDNLEVPDFQRGFVWEQTQASRLIESFLEGLPVPAVYLYNRRGTAKYLVIDGQQRLASVFCYFEGTFPASGNGPIQRASLADGSIFRLTGLAASSRFNGHAFSELPGWDQRRLRNAVLRAYVVLQTDTEDETSLYDLFERLNTGGTRLENQEIRNAIYGGRFVVFLDDINALPSWRAILGAGQPDRRKRDIELIVRFFATRSPDTYQQPMKKFLSQYMSEKRSANDETLRNDRYIFERTCAAVVEALGTRPFHGDTGLLDVPVMDSVMAAFSWNLPRIPEDIRSRFDTLVANDAYARNTKQGTTEADRLIERFRQASEVLFGQ